MCSHVQLFVTPWTAAQKAFLSITYSQSLLKIMSIESVMPSNLLILCCPLHLLPSIFPSISSVSSVQSAVCQASLSITNSWSLLKLMSIKSVMPSNLLILYCHLPLLPSVFPSIKVFSKETVLHIRWPNSGNFSFSISLSNEYSGLISFRIDWLDLLAVQGTFKSLI